MASRWWLLFPRPLRTLPADLAATALLTLLACGASLLPIVNQTPLRIIFGLPLVLFLPGYALIAALFPEQGTGTADTEDDGKSVRNGIDGVERVALSFGLSIAVTPLLGLGLNFTPWGIRLLPILIAIGGFTLLATGVATLRRRDLAPEDRFRVPYDVWLAAGRRELLGPETRVDAALNILLALSVLIAVASVGYAVAVPKQGEAFTEFYLLTHQENGTLVAANYPTEFRQGQSKPVVVGIGNHEHHAENYSVLVELQRVHVANNSTTVLKQKQLQRFSTRVAANETWHSNRSITPTMTGQRLRLAFLLYKDGAPPNSSTTRAYREVHLWVNVTATQPNAE